MENKLHETYDIAVVGAGHAGCEAALAAARLGFETILFTVSMDSVALMPCNPNIGGTSKGHLVREVDALGGEMGKNIDKTFIQSRMLNKSKGPAVHSLRAQADKAMYSLEMRRTLQNTPHLILRQAEISDILTRKIESSNSIIQSEKTDEENQQGKPSASEYSDSENADETKEIRYEICGVKTYSGATYDCRAVILCTGTYLKARCLYGDVIEYTGPNGLKAANYLSESLQNHGIKLQRFKTGTPARIAKDSIDFSKMEEQRGDEPIVPFSFTTNPADIQKEQVKCYLTYTNEETHRIIREHLDESPIYAGIIEGTGPRYCPSIEDKVVKFADKDRHQLFVEPEGLYNNEMYISGMSSSMPEAVQHEMYRSVAGLENARITRNAYAIEYDCIDARELYPTLEFKKIAGLFAGGQFNGSSGYEEAAAQGLVAGINAAMKLKEREMLVLKRSEAYIGVLIDDLVTKENHEPYRMMTSRAEYRLFLRQDNADLRLTKIGYEIGLIDKERYEAVCEKERQIVDEIKRVKAVSVGASADIQAFLEKHESIPLKKGVSLADLMRRPELSYQDLAEIDPDRPTLSDAVTEQVEICIKYEGYLERQAKQIEEFQKLEDKHIPEEVNYNEITSLRLEARQKLTGFRPITVGQASRISGVSPADISVLLVYLEQGKYLK